MTAGPTREYIDPIRFISNSSTGFFGYQIASEAIRRGHKVTLVSGPTCLTPPKGARFIPVISAAEMKRQVEKFFGGSDCLIMSAAVADYRPLEPSPRKIKKDRDFLTIKLQRTPDILSTVARREKRKVVIGFALESGGLLKNAKEKLKSKNLDYIIATSMDRKRSPFGDRRIRVLIVSGAGNVETILSSKKGLSRIILDKAEAATYYYNRNKV